MPQPIQNRRVLITGGAGFIGSHLADALRKNNEVTILDNLSTGKPQNVPEGVRLVRGDIRDDATLGPAIKGVEIVFHEAALPSVVRSIEDPLTSFDVNARGTLAVLEAARRAGVERFVYAASSSAYGNSPTLPKHEAMPPDPLSPYAASKLAGEGHVRAYAHVYGLNAFSLRYFNVYGPRQDPDSPYAAVIPRFTRLALQGKPVTIDGDGSQTRDFTFIDDVVRANLLAAQSPRADGTVLNIAGGERTSLLDLLGHLERLLDRPIERQHGPPRPGDVRDSFADVAQARRRLGYEPGVALLEGLRRCLDDVRTPVPRFQSS